MRQPTSPLQRLPWLLGTGLLACTWLSTGHPVRADDAGFAAGLAELAELAQSAPPAATPAAPPTGPASPPTGPGAQPQGTPLLGDEPITWLLRHLPRQAGLSGDLVAAAGPTFQQALRLETSLQPDVPWALQIAAPLQQPLQRGDVMLASFYVRGLKTADPDGLAKVEFVLEKAGPPWDKSVTYLAAVPADGRWRRFDIPFTSQATYAAGQAHITLRLGFAPQSLEIAGFQLTNYRQTVALRDLPSTRYPGQEADAAWRRQAQARIAQLRQADLRVEVVDAAGRPVSGATVGVHMRRHAFPFGTAVREPVLNHPDQTRFRESLRQFFNVAVLENALKWPNWEGWGRPAAEEALRWLADQGIPVRGHTLVWPGWSNLPSRLQSLKGDPHRLQQAVLDHIREEVTALRGRVIHWDVVNEPYTNHDLMDILGPEAMVAWFQAARAADPQAKLFVNDYGILSNGGFDRRHQDHYFETIRFLLDQGAPLDGIGLQGHFGSTLTAPERLLAILDRFATLGKPIWITEFDLELADEQLQAEYLRDFFTAVFSHPAVEGILMWGFWDGAHWKGNAPLFRRDWSLKPAGQAWLDLVFGEWWTDVTGVADEHGRYAVRGFLGDYDIEVRLGQRTATVPARLSREGATVRVVLP